MLALLVAVFAASCAPGSPGVQPADAPADHRALNDLSAAENSAGRFAAAFEAAEQAIQAKPDYSFAWNNKAVALLGLDRPVEALAAIERSVELLPDNAAAWNNRSAVLSVLGRFSEAVASAERALQQDPRNAVIWYNKACYLALQGNREAALGSLATALEIDPGLKDDAAREQELTSLRDDPEFRKLVQ